MAGIRPTEIGSNYHVIEGCKEVRVAGQNENVKVIDSDLANDLALLQLPRGGKESAKLTDEPQKLRQGEDIVVYGYPQTLYDG